jgi:hypothetical protein
MVGNYGSNALLNNGILSLKSFVVPYEFHHLCLTNGCEIKPRNVIGNLS